mmetsp:Transcript_11379/g.32316  ORF Transcript_11379/g.32316 Transcript_11379/m.32316 type:complete len:92 (+) Transcript_11379:128-403(+)|eukprot:CAMPEP_0117649296 /NCGR_PEP_ID=MMETSP0804-20121206/892_1 /TAXON_ID=1074897 /ORGANISM="Tetraselmis astigmatica, Strain CCMP880" /LENGTH=91 /DNA_ID=CAMNT_0005455015 /DNA_START=38 /DNA_END=313 /DNA_ORIENTATION=-
MTSNQASTAAGFPLTLIKFRKHPVRQGAAGDYCVVEDVHYRLVHAYGQSSVRRTLSHISSSTPETGTAANTNILYNTSPLVYHGGGIFAGN